jgi:uncharacterized flavoprotein (TIGR03862 family)
MSTLAVCPDPTGPNPTGRNLTSVAIVGAGPAGLMAAEVISGRGIAVEIYDAMPSIARKFLIAGVGGLNLSHAEPAADFVARFGRRADRVGAWLQDFDSHALCDWASGLGIATFVGSSGRIFPTDMKAAPLLRAWLRRLRAHGVRLHLRQRWCGWNAAGQLQFEHADGTTLVTADATVLALGGGSWSRLGADGKWVDKLAARGVAVAPLRPANCGFEVDWSAHFRQRYAGAPVKPVRATLIAGDPPAAPLQGELVVTEYGVEGSLIYALAAPIRDRIEAVGSAELELDLAPGRSLERLLGDLSVARRQRSRAEHLRRHAGIAGVQAGLLYECLGTAPETDPQVLADAIKHLRLRLLRPRPLDEAISSAGGVCLEGMTADLMLRGLPGVFCAGEMLDWEAPTGGYLLTASLASGRVAGGGVLDWLQQRA